MNRPSLSSKFYSHFNEFFHLDCLQYIVFKKKQIQYIVEPQDGYGGLPSPAFAHEKGRVKNTLSIF